MKKYLPLLLALALLLTACSAGSAEPSPLPTAPVRVWDEAEPKPVSVSAAEFTGEAAEVYDAMSRMAGAHCLALDYSGEGVRAVQVRVYSLEDGVWEPVSAAASWALPGENGRLVLALESCFAEGWTLSVFGGGSGGSWPGEEVNTSGDCFTVLFGDSVSAMTAENIPVAVQVYDEYDPETDSGKVISFDTGSFFDPASLADYDAAWAVTLAFESEPYTGEVDPEYM